MWHAIFSKEEVVVDMPVTNPIKPLLKRLSEVGYKERYVRHNVLPDCRKPGSRKARKRVEGIGSGDG